MSKITRSTVKSFIKKAGNNLQIKNLSRFDGMTDGIERSEVREFRKAVAPDKSHDHENKLGVEGAWFVGSSRDSFEEYNDGKFIGIEVYNCCGSFVLAVERV